MRKKVRKSLAFLLALALVVSVMSGLGLSVSADDAQNEPVVTETEGEPAEEKPKVEESTPKEGEEEETADPDAEAVPEEKNAVSYTHLDVYKRQVPELRPGFPQPSAGTVPPSGRHW